MTAASSFLPLIGLIVLDHGSIADFLDFTLPALLAPGNLPALAGRGRLRIIGNGDTLSALQSMPAIDMLRARFSTTLAAHPAIADAPDPWAAAVADPEVRGALVLRLDPRVVWSDGALPAIVERLDAGARRVETVCLPIASEALRRATRRLGAAAGGLAPEFLAGLADREQALAHASTFRSRIAESDEPRLVRRIGSSRLAVHAADWDVVGEAAATQDGEAAFLDDPSRVIGLRIGPRSPEQTPASRDPRRSHDALIRLLAASPAARERFRRRFEIGEGATDEAAVAGLERELGDLAAALKAALAEPQYRLLFAAWTRPHVELATRVTLPSLMSPGNLGQFEGWGDRIPATILCLAADRPAFESAPAFRSFAAQRLIDWRFIDGIVDLLGDAREAILSEAFRAAMASHWDADSEPIFLLVKPGHAWADGTLATAARRILDGARAVLAPTPLIGISAISRQLKAGGENMSPQALAGTVLDDPLIEETPLWPLSGQTTHGMPDRIAVRRGARLALRAARWHPVALRPAGPVEARRQSLLDGEIVPEFADDESAVHRVASSEEALIVDARPPLRRAPAEEVSIERMTARIALWATPWYRRNLLAVYTVLGGRDEAANGADPIPAFAFPPSCPPVPARRHTAWLCARGLRPIPPRVGEERRYRSRLQTYYRVACEAVESTAAEEAIYAGHADPVFAPLLARHFERAYLCSLHNLLADPEAMRDPQRPTAHILHLDPALFEASCLSGRADGLFFRLAECRQPAILIVESPDDQGGLGQLDLARARQWHARVAPGVEALGMRARLMSTLVDFFDGHPGFLFSIAPESTAEPLALPPPPLIGRDRAASSDAIVEFAR